MENNHNKEQDRRIDKMEGHIETTNQEMGEIRDHIVIVKLDVTEVKTDVAWLKKTYWVVVSASLGAVIVGVINLLIK